MAIDKLHKKFSNILENCSPKRNILTIESEILVCVKALEPMWDDLTMLTEYDILEGIEHLAYSGQHYLDMIVQDENLRFKPSNLFYIEPEMADENTTTIALGITTRGKFYKNKEMLGTNIPILLFPYTSDLSVSSEGDNILESLKEIEFLESLNFKPYDSLLRMKKTKYDKIQDMKNLKKTISQMEKTYGKSTFFKDA